MKKLPILISIVASLAVGIAAGIAIGISTSNAKSKPISSSEPTTSSQSSTSSSLFTSSQSSTSSSSTSSFPVVVNYTVSFKNYDGTLLSETVVEEGKTATYTGPTPTRAETAEATYTFSGWDQPLENITSDCVRVAQYTETLKPVTNYYKVTFKNYNDTLLQEVTVEEGHTAVYTGQTPTKPNTPTHQYAFTGWDASLENITSDCVRVAQFSETQTKYTVSFKNYDGTLLYETYVEAGKTATYMGPTPTREEDAERTYTFKGWDHSLENITEDLICVAQYNETLKPVTIYYKVTFKNYDGTILQEVNVEEGKNATYTGATPTRTNTPEFTYTFTGWDGSLENITADCVRIAQYSTTNVEYTVKFYNYDNQLLYTDVVYYQGTATYYGETPTREATSAYYYTFKGWDKELTNVTKSFSTKALYDAHGVSKQITLKPSNGQPDSVMNVTYGEAYDLGTPVNTGFTFLGWFSNETTAIPTSGTWEYTDVSVLTAKWGTGYYEFVENEDGYTVSLTDEGKNVSEIVIPTSFNGKSVTALGANFLKQNTVIEKITIPGTIKNIPEYSFYYCTKLSEVVFNDGLLTIGQHAFEGCKLTKLIIPSTCTTIGRSAFDYNKSLYHIYIPSSVETIEAYAFDVLTNLTYICIEHESIPSGWSSNWSSCVTYTGTIKLVEGEDFNYAVRSIYGDMNVTVLRLSDETSKLQNYTFPSEIEGITNIRLAQKLFVNNKYIRNINLTGVTRIGENVFNSCTNLETVTFSNSLTFIGSGAFRYCYALTRVEIPSSVTEIQSCAFDSCTGLTYIYIPNTVITIGNYAFDVCNKSTIYTNAHSANSGWSSSFKGNQPIYYDFVSLNELEDFNYVVQSYLGDSYVTITGVKASAKQKKNLVIPDEIEGINDIRLTSSLCSEMHQLVSIDLGTGVTKVPNFCFLSCINLETVVLHDGVTSIGQKAFYNCAKLSSINMPASLTTISSQAFDYCYALREVVIPIGVTTIGSYAFDDSGRMALLIEASVTQPGWSSNWYGSTTANKQIIYDYVSSGAADDFRYVKTSNGVTDAIHILGLVEGSTNVNLVVPDQIEGVANIKIATYAFDGNTIIKTVDLGASVTYIGTYAFRGNSSLVSVIIPAACTVIKNDAFNNLNSSCVLYCEAPEKPTTWETNWNRNSYQVVWGYTR